MTNVKGTEITTFEKHRYGMTEAVIREEYMNSVTARLIGLEKVVQSVLSDAQELLVTGRYEDSYKQMNVAKFILSEMLEAKTAA